MTYQFGRIPVSSPTGKAAARSPARSRQRPVRPFQQAVLQRALQLKAAGQTGTEPAAATRRGGLPERLKAGVESLSGLAMDDVSVHRDSSEPARFGALAYTRGSDIHLGPGQERHLPHEAWHVVQQKQGRVKPTLQLKAGVSVNDDQALESEADRMGARASAHIGAVGAPAAAPAGQAIVQRVKKKDGVSYAENETEARQLMIAYAKRIDHKPSASDLEAAIEVAQNQTLGIDQGERIILQKLLDAQEAERRKKREDAHKEAYERLLEFVTEDGICESALKAAFKRYVANPTQPNISIGSHTDKEARDALAEWKTLNGTEEGVEFWGYPPTDKAAQGKANVGATLATRKIQANLLVKWGGTTINVHMDIKD